MYKTKDCFISIWTIFRCMKQIQTIIVNNTADLTLLGHLGFWHSYSCYFSINIWYCGFTPISSVLPSHNTAFWHTTKTLSTMAWGTWQRAQDIGPGLISSRFLINLSFCWVPAPQRPHLILHRTQRFNANVMVPETTAKGPGL